MTYSTGFVGLFCFWLLNSVSIGRYFRYHVCAFLLSRFVELRFMIYAISFALHCSTLPTPYSLTEKTHILVYFSIFRFACIRCHTDASFQSVDVAYHRANIKDGSERFHFAFLPLQRRSFLLGSRHLHSRSFRCPRKWHILCSHFFIFVNMKYVTVA